MNEFEKQLAQATVTNQVRRTPDENSAAAQKAGAVLRSAVKDFATGILRGNTTDFLNLAQRFQDSPMVPSILKVIQKGQEVVTKAATTRKAGSDAEPIPDHERPIGDVVLEKITGLKKSGSTAEEAGSMLSAGGLLKKGAAATAMIVPAIKAGRPQLYDKAVEMLRANPKIGNKELFEKTGTYVDSDGALKAFMSDKDGHVTIPVSDQQAAYKLGEILDHPKLFEAYPNLKSMRVEVNPNKPAGTGSFNSTNLGEYIEIGGTGLVSEKRSTLLHEIQHSIQKDEGYSRGANPKMFQEIDPVSVQEKINRARASGDASQIDAANRFARKANAHLQADRQIAHAKYENVAGEQEARFTQFTENMNDVEGNTFLKKVILAGDTPQTWDTQAVPSRSNVITKKD